MIADLQPYTAMKGSGVPWLGEVSEHWEVRRLKQAFIKIIGGSTPSSAEPSYWGGEIVWVTPADVSKTVRLGASQRRITTEGLAACSTELVPPGSIVVTSRAPVGNVAIAEVELCTNQGCKALVMAPTVVEPMFGFHVFRTLKEELQSLATGTTFTEISTTRIVDVRIPIPPLPEQSAIVRFLDRADRRIRRYIRAKQKLIKLLEEQKQAIIHRAVTRGLDPNVRLKPSGVEWLGEVPAHWLVVPLRWYIEIGSGDFIAVEAVSEAPNDQNVVPAIGGNGVMGYCARFNAIGIAIVIGRVGALCGNVHLVEGRAWVTDNALRITRARGFDPEYLALQLRACNLNRLANANAQPLITGGIVKQQRFARPPLEEQRLIVRDVAERIEEVSSAVVGARRGIDLLREYRTRLIADVVTGKLDVREAAARLPQEAEEPETLDEAEVEGDAQEGVAGDGDAVPEEAEA